VSAGLNCPDTRMILIGGTVHAPRAQASNPAAGHLDVVNSKAMSDLDSRRHQPTPTV
jgi:hypothetical protein